MGFQISRPLQFPSGESSGRMLNRWWPLEGQTRPGQEQCCLQRTDARPTSNVTHGCPRAATTPPINRAQQKTPVCSSWTQTTPPCVYGPKV